MSRRTGQASSAAPWVLGWALSLWAVAAYAGVPACEGPAYHAPDIAPGTVFAADLAPLGAVCFAARKVSVPEFSESDYLQFELSKEGKAVTVLERPARYLWSGGCRVMAVSFPRLTRGPQRSIVVLGRCNTAQDEVMQPLVYRGNGRDFVLDTALSVEATGLDSIAKVVARARKSGGRGPGS